MLNDFGGHDDVKITITETSRVVIDAETMKWNMRKRAACELNAVLAWVAAYHVKARRRQSTTKSAVATTKVQNPLRRNLTASR